MRLKKLAYSRGFDGLRATGVFRLRGVPVVFGEDWKSPDDRPCLAIAPRDYRPLTFELGALSDLEVHVIDRDYGAHFIDGAPAVFWFVAELARICPIVELWDYRIPECEYAKTDFAQLAFLSMAPTEKKPRRLWPAWASQDMVRDYERRRRLALDKKLKQIFEGVCQ